MLRIELVLCSVLLLYIDVNTFIIDIVSRGIRFVVIETGDWGVLDRHKRGDVVESDEEARDAISLLVLVEAYRDQAVSS